MEREDRTVYEGGQGEIIEKKSRFIATVKPVKTEEEALELIVGSMQKLLEFDITTSHTYLYHTLLW